MAFPTSPDYSNHEQRERRQPDNEYAITAKETSCNGHYRNPYEQRLAAYHITGLLQRYTKKELKEQDREHSKRSRKQRVFP